MRLFKAFSLLLFLLVLSACSHEQQKPQDALRPMPTDGTIINYGEEEFGGGAARRAWEAAVHRSAPTTDWQAVEYATSMERHHARQAARRQRSNTYRPGYVTLANGQLEGQWNERGSFNQAGSVMDQAYDPDADALTVIAAGGSLWRIDLATETWTLINQDLRLNRGMLHWVQLPDASKRLISYINRQPHYSDDGGLSWLPANTGATNFDASWARFGRSYTARFAGSDRVFFRGRTYFYPPDIIYYSKDGGASYEPLHAFPEDSGTPSLSKAHHSEDIFVLHGDDSNTTLYQIDYTGDSLQTINTSQDLDWNQGSYKLSASYQADSSLRLLAYNSNRLYTSLDTGQTWTTLSELPVSPWSVGIYESPSNPDYLVLGAVNLYYSNDGGQSWEEASVWWEYYDNVPTKLHADMMHFGEYERPDGESYLYVSCHGGLSVGTADPTVFFNLSLEGLNVSQYYNTATTPVTEDQIFAGSQDQGLQFSTSNLGGVEDFDQVISGDYGHLSYSNLSDHLYAMYPGGSISKWRVADAYNTAWWRLDSEDEFIWITPFMVVPDDAVNPSDETVYMAGGSASGGQGSYLMEVIELPISTDDSEFAANNLPFNFLDDNNEGQLTAVAYSPLNTARFYVATENGRFYHSDNRGQDWEQTINFLPSGFYLYGQAILPSSLDSNLVYLGGSGYDNPAVYRSTDGGVNFSAMNNGLPPTVVLGMAANPTEELIFAATEAGPFVYITAEEQWYDLTGLDAPAGRYYDVEFLPESNIARFSTYNRGVWDFELTNNPTSNRNSPLAKHEWTAFPNPTQGVLQVNNLHSSTQGFSAFATSGQMLTLKMRNGQLDLSKLPAGTYFIQPVDVNGQASGMSKKITKSE